MTATAMRGESFWEAFEDKVHLNQETDAEASRPLAVHKAVFPLVKCRPYAPATT